MTAGESAGALQKEFGEAVEDIVRFRDEVTAVVRADRLIDVCSYCKESEKFDFLSDISCVDWLERDPRFDVVYHLNSLPRSVRLRLKVRVNEGHAVPSVIGVWAAANWAEREVWDLFGIEFDGHPDLRRLLLPDGWIGHPLRKDYPQSQIALPRPKSDKSFAPDASLS